MDKLTIFVTGAAAPQEGPRARGRAACWNTLAFRAAGQDLAEVAS